jgi:hypothetical protein
MKHHHQIDEKIRRAFASFGSTAADAAEALNGMMVELAKVGDQWAQRVEKIMKENQDGKKSNE